MTTVFSSLSSAITFLQSKHTAAEVNNDENQNVPEHSPTWVRNSPHNIRIKFKFRNVKSTTTHCKKSSKKKYMCENFNRWILFLFLLFNIQSSWTKTKKLNRKSIEFIRVAELVQFNLHLRTIKLQKWRFLQWNTSIHFLLDSISCDELVYFVCGYSIYFCL